MDIIAGIDTGGTFTDFVLADPHGGALFIFKEPSTPDDPSEAVEQGIRELLERGTETGVIRVVGQVADDLASPAVNVNPVIFKGKVTVVEHFRTVHVQDRRVRFTDNPTSTVFADECVADCRHR